MLATNLERAKQTFIYAHHGTRIVKLSTVVRCTEQGHKLALGEELVTVLDDLVGTADEIHVVLLEEARYDVRPECEADASVIFTPTGNILVGVGPQQVAEQAAVGDLLDKVRICIGRPREKQQPVASSSIAPGE